MLVNGGEQQRCFTYINDGINALIHIIENKNDTARNQIFNIGNPKENISIRSLAEMLIAIYYCSIIPIMQQNQPKRKAR